MCLSSSFCRIWAHQLDRSVPPVLSWSNHMMIIKKPMMSVWRKSRLCPNQSEDTWMFLFFNYQIKLEWSDFAWCSPVHLSCHLETETNSSFFVDFFICRKKLKCMIAVNVICVKFVSSDSGWSCCLACCVSQCLTLLISIMLDVLIGLLFIFHNCFGTVDPRELQEMSK